MKGGRREGCILRQQYERAEGNVVRENLRASKHGGGRAELREPPQLGGGKRRARRAPQQSTAEGWGQEKGEARRKKARGSTSEAKQCKRMLDEQK